MASGLSAGRALRCDRLRNQTSRSVRASDLPICWDHSDDLSTRSVLQQEIDLPAGTHLHITDPGEVFDQQFFVHEPIVFDHDSIEVGGFQ